jgi:hypothetical protein
MKKLRKKILKKLDISLYKSLIEVDFFLIKKTFKKLPLFRSDVLNLFELSQNIKLFVRYLRFLRYRSRKENLFIILVTKSLQTLYLLKTFLSKYPVKLRIQFRLIKFFGFTTVLVLQSFTSKDQKTFLKHLSRVNLFFVYLMSSRLELVDYGLYHLYNESKETRKLIFIFILFRKIFNSLPRRNKRLFKNRATLKKKKKFKF